MNGLQNIKKKKKIWDAVETQLFQCLITEVVNKGKYRNPKLKTYGDKVAVQYDGKEVALLVTCDAWKLDVIPIKFTYEMSILLLVYFQIQ